MRQHVNPLSRFFQVSRVFPAVNQLFADPTLPLHLDIGSARGQYLLGLAPLHDNWNFLGVEIRQKLVDLAKRDSEALGIKNLNFFFCNANVNLDDWLYQLPTDLLQRVSIQFPDPWFKRRHYKRRVLQPSLLIALSSVLNEGRELFIKSDISELIDSMAELIELSDCYTLRVETSSQENLSGVMSVPTERETYAIKKKLPVYSLIYQRNNKKVPPLSVLEESWQMTRSKSILG